MGITTYTGGYFVCSLSKLTMPIRRKPGEILEVDWAGSTLHVFDRDTSEKVEAYIFIATLPYSQHSYVEAFLDMKSASWLIAHIHAFEFLGGVTEIINRLRGK